MSRRFGILFSDGDLCVCREGHGIDHATKQMVHADDDAVLVEVELRIVKKYGNPHLQAVTDHSAICPTCHTEVFIEIPKAKEQSDG